MTATHANDASDLALLRDSVRGVLSAYPERLRASHGTAPPGAAREVVAAAAVQGWTALLLPEAAGGLGLGMREAVVVAEEFGRALAPAPLLAHVVLVPLLAEAGGWLSDLAGEVAQGDRLVSAAPFTRGVRCLVEHGGVADAVLLVESGAEGWAIHRCPPDGLELRQSLDPACPVAEWSGDAPASEPIRIDPVRAASITARLQLWIAAELLGVSEQAGAMSIEQARTRSQFGRPIGAYQAVKHRIVDDYILRRNAAALVAEAAAACDADDVEHDVLCHAARSAATAAALRSSGHCIQVHGAFGFSVESLIHLSYTRTRRLVAMFGDDGRSRRRIADRVFREDS